MWKSLPIFDLIDVSLQKFPLGKWSSKCVWLCVNLSSRFTHVTKNHIDAFYFHKVILGLSWKNVFLTSRDVSQIPCYFVIRNCMSKRVIHEDLHFFLHAKSTFTRMMKTWHIRKVNDKILHALPRNHNYYSSDLLTLTAISNWLDLLKLWTRRQKLDRINWCEKSTLILILSGQHLWFTLRFCGLSWSRKSTKWSNLKKKFSSGLK